MNACIAIPYENGNVFQHFGKATTFKIYTIENDAVVKSEIKDTEGAGHEELGLWLVWQGVNAVICGGIGPGAMGALAGAGIPAVAGVEGSADDAVAKLIAGTLVTASEPTCGGHAHGGCGGHCGGCHGCHH